jgi:WD40 repeat protein
VLVDTKGQRWAQSDRLLELAVPRRQPGPDPGPALVDLHASPDSRWLIADFGYVGSRLVDLSSGKIQPVVTGTFEERWRFWDWHPGDQRALVSAKEGFALIDLVSHEYEALDYSLQPEHAQISEVAYSPRGHQLADAVIYPPIYGVKESWSAEVGLREEKTGERRPIVQMAGGTYFADHSLVWSPDGQRLIWIVQAVPSDADAQVGLADTQVRLWMADLSEGNVEALAVLGKAVEYYHSAAWSPDGRTIAALTVGEALEGKIIASNVLLFDVESETERRITHYTDRRLSHLTWSPDGQWLAFTVSSGEYGEIWVTSLDGTLQYPIAGPTVPDAPFVWLPAIEGGG